MWVIPKNSSLCFLFLGDFILSSEEKTMRKLKESTMRKNYCIFLLVAFFHISSSYRFFEMTQVYIYLTHLIRLK